MTQTPRPDPTGMPPVAIVTDIIDSYARENLWKQWGKPEWAVEEIAHRERAMQELRNRGFVTLVPLIKQHYATAKTEGRVSPARKPRKRGTTPEAEPSSAASGRSATDAS